MLTQDVEHDRGPGDHVDDRDLPKFGSAGSSAGSASAVRDRPLAALSRSSISTASTTGSRGEASERPSSVALLAKNVLNNARINRKMLMSMPLPLAARPEFCDEDLRLPIAVVAVESTTMELSLRTPCYVAGHPPRGTVA